jgi:Na+-transporting NADH:ubiquinone oxidoreductase subunit NqrC
MTALERLQAQAAISQLQTRHKTSHVLHLILSICTAGLWIPVWALVALSNSIERAKVVRSVMKGL